MGLVLSYGVARNQNSLPHSIAAAVAVAVSLHAHIEAGNMEAWLRPLLARPNRFSWLIMMMMMMMMHALTTTIGGSGSGDPWAVLRVGEKRRGGRDPPDQGLYGPTRHLGSTATVSRERVRVLGQARFWIAGSPRRQHGHSGLVEVGV